MECSVVIHQAVEQAPCQLKWLCVSGASVLCRCDLLPGSLYSVVPHLIATYHSPLPCSPLPLPQIDYQHNWLMTLAIFWQPFSAIL